MKKPIGQELPRQTKERTGEFAMSIQSQPAFKLPKTPIIVQMLCPLRPHLRLRDNGEDNFVKIFDRIWTICRIISHLLCCPRPIAGVGGGGGGRDDFNASFSRRSRLHASSDVLRAAQREPPVISKPPNATNQHGRCAITTPSRTTRAAGTASRSSTSLEAIPKASGLISNPRRNADSQ